MARANYYPKRQVVSLENFEEIDFNETVLLCVPRFAWRVARSYLAEQAQWESTYSIGYYSDYYETPTPEQLDVVRANLDLFLSEDDMSCDIVGALNQIASAIGNIAPGESSGGCCPYGTQGAGLTEAPGSTFYDDGETPPAGFEEYSEWQSYRCKAANLIVNQLVQDVTKIKDQALTLITAELLSLVIVTPIPFDDIGALTTVIVVYGLELALDNYLTEIINSIAYERKGLVCRLYNALDITEAKGAFEWFSDNILVTIGARVILGYFVNNDSLNRLFEANNFVTGDDTCSLCNEVQSIYDTFTDIDDTLLTAHTPDVGGPWAGAVGTWRISSNQAKSSGAAGSKIFIDPGTPNYTIEVILTPYDNSNRTALQGLCFRGSDLNNHYQFTYSGGVNAALTFGQRYTGTYFPITVMSVEDTYDPMTLRVECDGTIARCFRNGVLIFTKEMAFNFDATQVGITAGQQSLALFDEFKCDVGT